MTLAQELLRFLREDLGRGDVTSEALIPEKVAVRAAIVAKERGVLAGIEECQELLRHLGIEVKHSMRDGEEVREGSVALELVGNARSILGVERTLLNLLGHMSGIATLTRSLVEEARAVNPKVRIAATRKTLPGLRFLEKKAVSIGGGDPHRFDLSDMVLIKDNHLKIVGDVAKAVREARRKAGFAKKVEVEVTSAKEAIEAAKAGADIVMLDNMTPDQIEEALRALFRAGLREHLTVEVSGRISKENLAEYAKLDIDVISLGMLTHSAKSLDFSLEIVEVLA